MANLLFTPLKIKNVTFKNRIVMSPMCQYSAINGHPNEWHLVHYGSRAIGGAGLIILEAASVSPNGCISNADLGIWSDEHIPAFQKLISFLKKHGTCVGIQLAHAGRKAGNEVPTPIIAPSPIAFDEKFRTPTEMSISDINETINKFAQAAQRADAAGFDVIELHMAHGYLMHQYLSPLSNHRKDEYGGSLENRMRLPLQIVAAVQKVWPIQKPLLVRISATDWADRGWDLKESLTLCRELKKLGVDVIDCSSGGTVGTAKIPIGPSYQVTFADSIKKETGILTGAVGLITEGIQAEEILSTNKADLIFLGRVLLRDPYWPLHAAHELKHKIEWPTQYLRGKLD